MHTRETIVSSHLAPAYNCSWGGAAPLSRPPPCAPTGIFGWEPPKFQVGYAGGVAVPPVCTVEKVRLSPCRCRPAGRAASRCSSACVPWCSGYSCRKGCSAQRTELNRVGAFHSPARNDLGQSLAAIQSASRTPEMLGVESVSSCRWLWAGCR
eukprot:1171163-Prorocentrum_minimum.AAC.4